MISCRFCGTANARHEDRCFRCGRRLHLANARPAPDSYRAAPTSVVRDATPPTTIAPEVRVVEVPTPEVRFSPSEAGVGGTGTAARMAPMAVPDPTPPAPARPLPVAAAKINLTPAPAGRDLSHDGLPGEGEWGSLSFQHTKERERAPESDLYTDDTVAPLPARMMAGVYDGMVMAAAFGLMSIAYAVMTRNLGDSPIPDTPTGWAIYFVLMLAVIVFYRALFVLAGGDSPGMRWAGLRLVTFDGDAPTTYDRFMRIAWGAFSALPLGLGLFWALVDQERLTWHDLLSKTFPSPDATTKSLPRWFSVKY